MKNPRPPGPSVGRQSCTWHPLVPSTRINSITQRYHQSKNIPGEQANGIQRNSDQRNIRHPPHHPTKKSNNCHNRPGKNVLLSPRTGPIYIGQHPPRRMRPDPTTRIRPSVITSTGLQSPEQVDYIHKKPRNQLDSHF